MVCEVVAVANGANQVLWEQRGAPAVMGSFLEEVVLQLMG